MSSISSTSDSSDSSDSIDNRNIIEFILNNSTIKTSTYGALYCLLLFFVMTLGAIKFVSS